MVVIHEFRTAALSEMARLMLEIGDPQNAFTVWAKTVDGLLYLGGASTLDAARDIAEKNSLMKDRFVLTVYPKEGTNGIITLPDVGSSDECYHALR